MQRLRAIALILLIGVSSRLWAASPPVDKPPREVIRGYWLGALKVQTFTLRLVATIPQSRMGRFAARLTASIKTAPIGSWTTFPCRETKCAWN